MMFEECYQRKVPRTQSEIWLKEFEIGYKAISKAKLKPEVAAPRRSK